MKKGVNLNFKIQILGNLQNWPKNDSHRHWNEFYQQSDIEALAEVGISHIRIPYGYWLVDVAGKNFLDLFFTLFNGEFTFPSGS